MTDIEKRLDEMEVKTIHEQYWVDIDPDVGWLITTLRLTLKQNALMREAIKEQHADWNTNGYCMAECTELCTAIKAVEELEE